MPDYRDCDQHPWALNRRVAGVLEIPVVHRTYLARAGVLGAPTYEDGSGRHEYVVFSDSARRAGVPRHLDNRQVYLVEGNDELPVRLRCRGTVQRRVFRAVQEVCRHLIQAFAPGDRRIVGARVAPSPSVSQYCCESKRPHGNIVVRVIALNFRSAEINALAVTGSIIRCIDAGV